MHRKRIRYALSCTRIAFAARTFFPIAHTITHTNTYILHVVSVAVGPFVYLRGAISSYYDIGVCIVFNTFYLSYNAFWDRKISQPSQLYIITIASINQMWNAFTYHFTLKYCISLSINRKPGENSFYEVEMLLWICISINLSIDMDYLDTFMYCFLYINNICYGGIVDIIHAY